MNKAGKTEFERYLSGELRARIIIPEGGATDIRFDWIKGEIDTETETWEKGTTSYPAGQPIFRVYDGFSDEKGHEGDKMVIIRDRVPQSDGARMIDKLGHLKPENIEFYEPESASSSMMEGAAPATNSADKSSISGVKPVSLNVVSVNLNDSNTIDLVVTTA